ncbi:hypothetical protein [Agaribacterium sp. ZY112]|uniref:hypothetical protein n=1 Tax=Agaribacterium sp. ZY112 TaxID=3233574 RepID=UPI003523F34D
MNMIGYGLVVTAGYLLFISQIVIGIFIFVIGGFLANKISFSLRSTGVVLLVGSIPYGYHNSFTPFVLFLIFIGFILACFNTRRARRDDGVEWGIDIGEFFSRSDSNDSGFGGGGDGGD